MTGPADIHGALEDGRAAAARIIAGRQPATHARIVTSGRRYRRCLRKYGAPPVIACEMGEAYIEAGLCVLRDQGITS